MSLRRAIGDTSGAWLGDRARAFAIAPADLTIHAAAGAPHRSPDARLDRVWASMCRENPRLFNGPVLSVGALDDHGRIGVRRDEYKRLAVHPEVPTGVVQLGVTGAVSAFDRARREHLVFGRRAMSTRVYGGMWELAPSGGVDPTGGDADVPTAEDLLVQLLRELEEELGLAFDPRRSIARADPAAIAVDPHAPSVDVVFRVRLDRPLEELVATTDLVTGSSRWEYDRVRWVAVEDVPDFVRAAGDDGLIPPLRPTLHAIGVF